MQFKLGFAPIALVAIGAAFVYAAPAGNGTAVFKRDTGNVKLCTDPGFTGDCTSYTVEITQCSNFPSALQDDVSSIAPDDNLHCIFYSCQNCNCDNYVYAIEAPGFSDLSAVGGGYLNDAFNSVVCYHK